MAQYYVDNDFVGFSRKKKKIRINRLSIITSFLEICFEYLSDFRSTNICARMFFSTLHYHRYRLQTRHFRSKTPEILLHGLTRENSFRILLIQLPVQRLLFGIHTQSEFKLSSEFNARIKCLNQMSRARTRVKEQCRINTLQ